MASGITMTANEYLIFEKLGRRVTVWKANGSGTMSSSMSWYYPPGSYFNIYGGNTWAYVTDSTTVRATELQLGG